MQNSQGKAHQDDKNFREDLTEVSYKLFAYLAKENSRQREEQGKDTEVKKYNEANVVSFTLTPFITECSKQAKEYFDLPKITSPKVMKILKCIAAG